MKRTDRGADELRPISIERNYLKTPDGSAMIRFGDTHVLCTAMIDEGVPPFLRGSGEGWVTAEYAMLPGSASGGRIRRNSSTKGRALEISRLIGRSLRSVTSLAKLGERQILIDCDVIQADGGTRTAAITGSYVALHDALNSLVAKGELDEVPLEAQCGAVSVGIFEGTALLDLCYIEDSAADVDLNLVMRSDGAMVEVQGTAEGEAFSRAQLDEMLGLGEAGINALFAHQREALGL